MSPEQVKVYQEIVSVCPTITQVVDLTRRIQGLSSHVISTKQKDKSAKRGMFILIGRRNRLLRYVLGKIPSFSSELRDLRWLVS